MNLIIYSLRFPDFRRTLCRICGKHLRVNPAQTNIIGLQSSLKTHNQSPIEMEGVSKIFHWVSGVTITDKYLRLAGLVSKMWWNKTQCSTSLY